MVTESHTEVEKMLPEIPADVFTEKIKTLVADLSRIPTSFRGTTATQSPQARYDHAKQIISEGTRLFGKRSQYLEQEYPELYTLFGTLGRSLDNAEEVIEKFLSGSANRNIKR
jgi:hypothetical protein